MPKISILGCGWLGLPLAERLLADGYAVKGSTTSTEKIPLLQAAGIEPFEIVLSADGVSGNIEHFLDSDILVIDIPPKLAQGLFTDKIKALLPHLHRAPVTRVLFVSSISVYAENAGDVDENSAANPETENGKQLLEAEALLRSDTHFQTTILRFGGLIGNGRHPVKYLAGRENIPSPDAPINLIDAEDCIGIIQQIIALEKWGQTYNAVARYHPTRKDYYTQKAEESGLSLPHFADDNASGKTVSSQKITADLHYDFRKPQL
ncbi:NAD(P)H-binding protein [Flavobacterium longum]|uniref:SDR family oxidoreductase n=1 Tax=Flavobacterium longum TaxID=1299340 RepID=UPI0039E9DC36